MLLHVELTNCNGRKYTDIYGRRLTNETSAKKFFI